MNITDVIYLLSDVNSLYGVIGGLSGCVLVLLIVSVAAIVVCLLQRQKSAGSISLQVNTSVLGHV